MGQEEIIIVLVINFTSALLNHNFSKDLITLNWKAIVSLEFKKLVLLNGGIVISLSPAGARAVCHNDIHFQTGEHSNGQLR